MIDVVDGHRSTLYLWEALKVLKKQFGDCSTDDLLELLASCVTVKKTTLMDIVGQHTERGEKSGAKKRMEESMDRVGAIRTKSYKKLELRKGKRK